jgi:hypothetical protein
MWEEDFAPAATRITAVRPCAACAAFTARSRRDARKFADHGADANATAKAPELAA